MPSPKELFDAGDLAGATEAVTKEVKAKPTDPGPRTFLFELLLFSGDLDRSEKQMEVLGTQGTETRVRRVPGEILCSPSSNLRNAYACRMKG